MSIARNTVLLLKSEKSEDAQDKYQDILESNKFEVMVVKTLTFQYKNIEILRDKLTNPDDFCGIILSSPRCVNACSQALGKERIHELWKLKSNFTVGEATYNEALIKIGIECEGKESGNARNLSQIIVQSKSSFNKPFLFPHGNLKTDTLKLELGRENLSLDEVLVYDTLPNPQIKEDLEKVTSGFSSIPEYLVFFSPSGFHSSIHYLRKVPIDLSSLKIIAIGPVTQLAIEENNLKVYAVAKAPTPEEVLKAIL
ncbi:uroporphyrinogen-III synthase-like [Zophobas morio]|uniref:uroporphyrinogen-III synthase-like n=1 Tax=Zophobas morio TaxID=2755281 RepID=UPI003083E1B2